MRNLEDHEAEQAAITAAWEARHEPDCAQQPVAAGNAGVTAYRCASCGSESWL